MTDQTEALTASAALATALIDKAATQVQALATSGAQIVAIRASQEAQYSPSFGREINSEIRAAVADDAGHRWAPHVVDEYADIELKVCYAGYHIKIAMATEERIQNAHNNVSSFCTTDQDPFDASADPFADEEDENANNGMPTINW